MVDSMSPADIKRYNAANLKRVSDLAKRVLSVVIKNKEDILYKPDNAEAIEAQVRTVNNIIASKFKKAYMG